MCSTLIKMQSLKMVFSIIMETSSVRFFFSIFQNFKATNLLKSHDTKFCERKINNCILLFDRSLLSKYPSSFINFQKLKAWYPFLSIQIRANFVSLQSLWEPAEIPTMSIFLNSGFRQAEQLTCK